MSATADAKDLDEHGPPELQEQPSEAPSTSRAEGIEDDDEDDDEAEPNLKYTKLTGSLGAVYRGGDFTSSVISSGDKLIIGTDNGNVHVLSIPSLHPLRVYHAHSATVSAVSVSPYSTSFSPATTEDLRKFPSVEKQSPATKSLSRNVSSQTTLTVARPSVPATPANSIYIATASIDGHVCVSSLLDPKDVTFRNYARPLQAVALSPEYKNDRAYLSGGLAGNLVLTSGVRQGVSSEANTNSAAATASGWLGSIGLASNTGKDTVLHSGEGAITTIAWSLTGKYVAWVNEQGIKIMRSNLNLTSRESDSSWKRLGHLDLDRPNRRSWEDMAGSFRARIQWIDETTIESVGGEAKVPNGSTTEEVSSPPLTPMAKAKDDTASIRSVKPKPQKHEKLIIGWGDTTWVVKVTSTFSKPEVLQKYVKSPTSPTPIPTNSYRYRFDDCIVSGLSLYTPNLLLILAYRTRDDDDNPISSNAGGTSRRKRSNGLPPDIRLIDLESEEEDKAVEVEGLHIARFETLAASDYHVTTTFLKPTSSTRPQQRRALGSMAGDIWDASINAGMNAGKMFGGAASIMSGSSGGEQGSTSVSQGSVTKSPTRTVTFQSSTSPALSQTGLKIFILSPYDCLVAVRRDQSDRLAWLVEHEQYKDAWNLLEANPSIISVNTQSESRPETPAAGNQSLVDFFADEASSQKAEKSSTNYNLAVEKEKLRIGDLWIQRLVSANEWTAAGQTAGKVLGTSSPKWEQWIWAFAHAKHIDEISPYMPSRPLKPPLPSSVYEVVLGHYINKDALRLQELIQEWDASLFDNAAVASAVESRLASNEVSDKTIEDGVQGRDWRILENCLATLHLSDSRPAEALKCYINVKNADAALKIIREYSLLDSISDAVYDFILLRVSSEQLKSPSTTINELDGLTSEPIQLLVDAAIQGLIPVDTVVSQLEDHAPTSRPFLFFYFRALWQGDRSTSTIGNKPSDNDRSASSRHMPERRSRFGPPPQTADSTSRTLIAPYADLTVTLFAEYSRPLLSTFLKTATTYSFDHASAECEARHYIPELVHLLSTTGQTRAALQLIIDEIGDVAQAIAFAQEMDDPGLWDDLLEYSMDKPAFIKGLLEDVGASLDPVALVKRIPEGLEIEGLKGALGKILREVDVQCSISEGAARVMRGEVANSLETLSQGRMKGVVFDVAEVEEQAHEEEKPDDSHEDIAAKDEKAKPTTARKKTSAGGICAICELPYTPDNMLPEADSSTKEHLIGFQCGHIFHLFCLLDSIMTDSNKMQINKLQQQLAGDNGVDDQNNRVSQQRGRVGEKVVHAQMISGVLGDIECTFCNKKKVVDDDTG